MNIKQSSRRFNYIFPFTILVSFLLLFTLSASAQGNRQLSGTIRGEGGQPLAGVTIKLVSEKDSIHSSSDQSGFYSFRNLAGTQFRMTLHSLGFDTLVHSFVYEANRDQLLLAPLVLKTGTTQIETVTVEGRAEIVVKEDTLEYNPRNLKLREGALVEDALKRLDGVEVDKDGNVKAQGENITRVRINGKDFFGGDVKAATKNLPANIIERIQIVDDYGDMANITGNRTGDPERVLNIMIDPSRNKGTMGNFRVGGGSEERYQATGMIGLMQEGLQFTALGNLNNVNASLFDFDTRGSGARRGGGGGGSFGRGGRGGGFGGGMFGAPSGLTNTNSLGLNYRQDVNEKLTMYGNYSFSHDKSTSLSYSINDFFNEQLVETNDSENGSVANSHRFDWNFEYKPTDYDYIKFSPTLSVRNTNSDGLITANNTLQGTPINLIHTNNTSKNFAPSYGASALYNRRLSDHGRNLFFDFNLNSSSTEQDQERIQETLLSDPSTDVETYIRTIADLKNQNMNGGASMSYTEPLGELSNLEITYDYNFRQYDNRRFDNALNQNGQQIDDEDVFIGDRIFDYSYQTHRVGANYRYRSDKFVYSLGASLEPNRLKGDATVQSQVIGVDRKGLNFAPIASFEYKMSRTKSFSVRYSGRSSEPSFSQLQPFTDYSNRNSIVTGNPNLDAEFTHEVRLNYRNFNMDSGHTWFVGVTGNLSKDKIVTNRAITVDPVLGVVQETSYLNTDGFYSSRGYYHYSIPMVNRTYVLNFAGMAANSNNISYTDDVKNVGENWNFMQSLNFRYTPNEFVEVSPGVSYLYNTTSNTGNRVGVNNDVSTWTYNLNSTLNLTPTLVFSTDLVKSTNSGYNAVVGSNPFIINAYIEKQFLKGRNGAIRFHAFDLLNEQTNVSRNVTDNLISDSRTNRLGQYFMLSISYRFQNFAGGQMEFDGPGGRNPHNPHGGQGGRGGRGPGRF